MSGDKYVGKTSCSYDLVDALNCLPGVVCLYLDIRKELLDSPTTSHYNFKSPESESSSNEEYQEDHLPPLNEEMVSRVLGHALIEKSALFVDGDSAVNGLTLQDAVELVCRGAKEYGSALSPGTFIVLV